MASGKTRSKHSKDLCTRYKAQNIFGRNKARKIARHVEANPNDAVAKAALKTAGKDTPTRQNIGSSGKHWTKQWKDFAHMLRVAGVRDSGNLALTKYKRMERAVYDRPVK